MEKPMPVQGVSALEIAYDRGRHWRARIGFVLLATEQTVEEDMFHLAPPGVGVHFTRVRIPDAITVETLGAVRAELADAAARILPDGNMDVLCYACTSGSIVIGEERVMAELSRGAPSARVTTLVTGVIRALRTLGAKRLVVGTPYLDEINVLERRYLEARGFEILDIQGMNILKDTDMVRVAPRFIMEFARSLDRPDAEAIFVSCGALRTLDIVDALEQKVGKPVVASNQAMFWDTLRLAGVEDRIEGYGQLLRSY
ncbi:MAG: arylmalonate decarboxylase [Deltaproteobacteria bacterium]|nr:arylmalonate decarboxylase [Deltaproteobacteria bacterium]